MTVSNDTYTNLVTAEHADKPRFMALVAGMTQPLVDFQNLLASLPGAFDLDTAIGAQLDVVGQWVGVARQLRIPLTGVYFSLDTVGLGFDQGTWKGPFDPDTQLVSLPDDAYRTLIRARILANTWDGTIQGAYLAYEVLFPTGNPTVVIFDHQDMSMSVALFGQLPDAVTTALLVNGLLNIKPSGVHLNGYFVPSVINAPLFGFDCENSTISGFDVGCWPTNIAAN